jgi:hypothetical protein
MLNTVRSVWRRGRSLLPIEGYAFDRPIVVLQSDDWGRVGVRDRDCWDELCGAGIPLGQHPYDFYGFETSEDVAAINALLQSHRDSLGRPACLGMTFIVANVDFQKVTADGFRQIHLRPLSDGLPESWNRPGLLQAFQEAISAGTLSPALHGVTHFCRGAVERYLRDEGERGILLRRLWSAGVPYIHWRMPWVGFEYWDSEGYREEAFLTSEQQKKMIGLGVEYFEKLFSQPARSACAPGYRANDITHKIWSSQGIHVAQNGPDHARPPHFDRNGILHVYRSMDFEPGINERFSLSDCLRRSEECFSRGLPAIISVHSINFHSTLKDFRSRTLARLDEFLGALKARHSDLLYLRDHELYGLVETGSLESAQSVVRIRVVKRKFNAGMLAASGSA